jgi:hypothetical protein
VLIIGLVLDARNRNTECGIGGHRPPGAWESPHGFKGQELNLELAERTTLVEWAVVPTKVLPSSFWKGAVHRGSSGRFDPHGRGGGRTVSQSDGRESGGQ